MMANKMNKEGRVCVFGAIESARHFRRIFFDGIQKN